MVLIPYLCVSQLCLGRTYPEKLLIVVGCHLRCWELNCAPLEEQLDALNWLSHPAPGWKLIHHLLRGLFALYILTEGVPTDIWAQCRHVAERRWKGARGYKDQPYSVPQN